MTTWMVGAMEREAAEELLQKQKADGVEFHALPFLIRKGNKGLTLTSTSSFLPHFVCLDTRPTCFGST